MAGSCSQYLIRWGKWAIPAPWTCAQIVLSSLRWPTVKAPREHSYIAEGTGRIGRPSVQLRSCFLHSAQQVWEGLNLPRDDRPEAPSPLTIQCIYLRVHHLLSSSTSGETATLAEDCGGQPEAKASSAARLTPAYQTKPRSSGRLPRQIHTYSFSVSSHF